MSDKNRGELLQGTLDLLILETLQLAPRHGWSISKRIQQLSSDVLVIQQGSLYPAALQAPGQRTHPLALGRV